MLSIKQAEENKEAQETLAHMAFINRKNNMNLNLRKSHLIDIDDGQSVSFGNEFF